MLHCSSPGALKMSLKDLLQSPSAKELRAKEREEKRLARAAEKAKQEKKEQKRKEKEEKALEKRIRGIERKNQLEKISNKFASAKDYLLNSSHIKKIHVAVGCAFITMLSIGFYQIISHTPKHLITTENSNGFNTNRRGSRSGNDYIPPESDWKGSDNDAEISEYNRKFKPDLKLKKKTKTTPKSYESFKIAQTYTNAQYLKHYNCGFKRKIDLDGKPPLEELCVSCWTRPMNGYSFGIFKQINDDRWIHLLWSSADEIWLGALTKGKNRDVYAINLDFFPNRTRKRSITQYRYPELWDHPNGDFARYKRGKVIKFPKQVINMPSRVTQEIKLPEKMCK